MTTPVSHPWVVTTIAENLPKLNEELIQILHPLTLKQIKKICTIMLNCLYMPNLPSQNKEREIEKAKERDIPLHFIFQHLNFVIQKKQFNAADLGEPYLNLEAHFDALYELECLES
jgi:hypothetical protein